MCYIAGWGTQKVKGPPTRVLHEAALPLVSHEQCNDPQSYNGVITKNMLCAGFQQGGVDTCEGDSGGKEVSRPTLKAQLAEWVTLSQLYNFLLILAGPLMCKGGEGRWYLTGVASFGHTGCGVPYKYGVYTRIVNHLDWISKVTGMNIQQPPVEDIPSITKR